MRKSVFWYVAVFVALLLSGGPVLAQILTVNGTIHPGNPTMPVVFISPPDCTGQGVTPVHYNVIPFYVTASGDYTVTLTSVGDIASIYIYESAFDPNDGLTNCIAADNGSAPISVTEPLTAFVQYFAVPFNDDFDQNLTIDYELELSGPGQILQGLFAVPIPTLSQWSLMLLAVGLALWTTVQLRRRDST